MSGSQCAHSVRSWVQILSIAFCFLCPMMARGADPGVADVTNSVRTTISDLTDSNRGERYYVDVRLFNKTNQDIQGPVVVMVEKTGIEDLKVTTSDGKLADGSSYVRVVGALNRLRAQSQSPTRRIYFKSEKKLAQDQTKKFQLELKVLVAKTLPKQSSRSGGNGNNPLPIGAGSLNTGGLNTGGRNGGANAAVKPEPDPAFTKNTGNGSAPADDGDAGAQRPIPEQEEADNVIKVQNQWTPTLLKKEGVHGTGTAWGKNGGAVIRVYVEDVKTKFSLPDKIDGVPVEPLVTGKIKALWQVRQNDGYPRGNRGHAGIFLPNRKDGNCTENPRRFFKRPTPIGISTFNQDDPICAAGTMGCRVLINRIAHVLSNSHVFAAEGNANVGDDMVQPGTLDFGCAAPDANIIANLEDFTVISFTGPNVVDGAVALLLPGTVGVSTPCDGYGAPRQTTLKSRLGLKVMKYGRTTSFRTSRCSAINVSLFVGYSGGVALFVNQDEYYDPNELSLGAPGDSGSLIVSNPRRQPVSLLFAGGGNVTFGNPIRDVLKRFNATIEGDPSVPSSDRIGDLK